jgi:hypothetical protein
LEPSNSPPVRYHWIGDVLEFLPTREWDLMIAHPPCTRLCNSGVRWLHERNLWDELGHAVEFFLKLRDAPIPHIAIENPIPHKWAVQSIGKPTQYVQPWQHGHGETKRTGLWLRGLPLLLTKPLCC